MIFSSEQPPSDDLRDALANLRKQDEAALDPDEIQIEQQMRDMATNVAAAPAPPVYNAVTSSAWRLLEEQRSHALDVVREAEIEIAKWMERRDDAQRAADGCAAGQQAMER